MKKSNLKFLIPLIITLVILTIIKVVEPEEVDWTHSFARKDKIPYGGFIINDLSTDLFPGQEVIVKELPIYNILKDNYYTNTNYVFIDTYFRPDRLDTEYLLQYAAEGNNVFISAFGIYDALADSLRIKSYDEFFTEDTVNINFNISQLRTEKGWTYSTGNFKNYFSEFDTSLVQVLGTNEFGQTNFIRIKFGNGNFFLHSLPLSFTNYHLLKSNNNEYVDKTLSHLPVQKTFWDDYYKAGNKYSASALNYIVSQKSLRTAYYIILISVVLFIFFYGRRKQRIIPVITPLTNTTIEFVETVGNLYYQQKNYKNIAEKKISYFLDYIRNKYFIKTNLFDQETIQKIAEKSSLSTQKIKSIFKEIEIIQQSHKLSEEELLSINSQIENFYERTK
jgi:hypothetical protein